MNLKVLLIDDDEIILLMHDLMIIESGLSNTTIGFESCMAALTFLENQHNQDERYLIFLDIHMPEMSGWQFLDTIQASPYKDRVSVVVTTSSIDSADHIMSRKYPAVTEYIEKPMTAEIFSRIKQRYA